MSRLFHRLADRLLRVGGPDAAMEIAKDLRAKGNFESAANVFADAQRLYIERLGETHPKAVAAMSQHAWCLAKLDRLGEARDLYRRAIDAKTAQGDREAPTAEVLENYLADIEARLAGSTSN